jgi:hypothetical protein
VACLNESVTAVQPVRKVEFCETIPQRLKPALICGVSGTTEVVPFQNALQRFRHD